MSTTRKCSNCLDQAACSTRLPRLFGRYVYTCLDKDGQLHIHRSHPFHGAMTVREKEGSPDYVIIGKDEHQEDILAPPPVPNRNLVFKLRLRGWLGRKFQCLGHPINWQLVSARNGNLFFRSYKDQTSVGFSLFSDKANQGFMFLYKHSDYLSYDAAVACGEAAKKFLGELVQFSIDTLYKNTTVEGMTPLHHATAVRAFMLNVQANALPHTPLTTARVLGTAQPFPGVEVAWQRASANGKSPVLPREMTPALEEK